MQLILNKTNLITANPLLCPFMSKNIPFLLVLMYWNELLFTIGDSRILNLISLTDNSANYKMYKFWHLIYDFIYYQYPVYIGQFA